MNTKVYGTFGPACSDTAVLEAMFRAGMTGMRLNLSHVDLEDAAEQIAEPVPLHIRNAPTTLMKQLDYGRGYQYAHDTQEKLTAMTCLPESLRGRTYYRPTREGVEGRFADRLAEINEWKAAARQAKKAREGK